MLTAGTENICSLWHPAGENDRSMPETVLGPRLLWFAIKNKFSRHTDDFLAMRPPLSISVCLWRKPDEAPQVLIANSSFVTRWFGCYMLLALSFIHITYISLFSHEALHSAWEPTRDRYTSSELIQKCKSYVKNR